jgi:hypothetical protein
MNGCDQREWEIDPIRETAWVTRRDIYGFFAVLALVLACLVLAVTV